MSQETLTQRFNQLRRQLRHLPEKEEPPPTTLQLLGQSRQEGDWQRFLAYFLTPEASHGLDHAAVEEFLQGLSARSDIDFKFSRFNLDKIKVATEVPIPDGRIQQRIIAQPYSLKLHSTDRLFEAASAVPDILPIVRPGGPGVECV